MINDQQRREAAARLRANAALGPNVLFDLHEAVGDATYTQAGLLNCLADLIDRQTCEMEVHQGERYGRCNHCGAFVRRDAVTNCTEEIAVKFCPNCGAEVVAVKFFPDCGAVVFASAV